MYKLVLSVFGVCKLAFSVLGHSFSVHGRGRNLRGERGRGMGGERQRDREREREREKTTTETDRQTDIQTDIQTMVYCAGHRSIHMERREDGGRSLATQSPPGGIRLVTIRLSLAT